jgi:hypothetical protein
MRSSLIVLILTLSTVAFAGVLPDSTLQILSHTANPNDIFKEVRFEPLSYAG